VIREVRIQVNETKNGEQEENAENTPAGNAKD